MLQNKDYVFYSWEIDGKDCISHFLKKFLNYTAVSRFSVSIFLVSVQNLREAFKSKVHYEVDVDEFLECCADSFTMMIISKKILFHSFALIVVCCNFIINLGIK